MRDDFEAKNKQLLDEMPRFFSSRLDYFQPSFESLIRAQVGHPGLSEPLCTSCWSHSSSHLPSPCSLKTHFPLKNPNLSHALDLFSLQQ